MIGSRGNPLLILGDLGYTVPATEFCSALTARVSQPDAHPTVKSLKVMRWLCRG